jgi:hypothetical protein
MVLLVLHWFLVSKIVYGRCDGLELVTLPGNGSTGSEMVSGW